MPNYPITPNSLNFENLASTAFLTVVSVDPMGLKARHTILDPTKKFKFLYCCVVYNIVE